MYLIGKTTTTHGIKGELKVINLSDFERFLVGDVVYIDDTPYEIQSSRVHKGKILISFKEMGNINDVLMLKDKDIYSKEKLEADSGYHYEDLIGLTVLDESNQVIGSVTGIREVPQGHILEVLHQQKTVLIPFVDAFIKDVTTESVTVYVIEGLL
ncbi:MAG: ribosome maturation factor RimM [Acholeplasmataceae bacterium]